MYSVRFIPVPIMNSNNETIIKYINIDHIQQIYANGDDIVLELTNYTQIVVKNQNINVFMDRFR